MYTVSFPALVVCVFFSPLFSLARGLSIVLLLKKVSSLFSYFCVFRCHSHLLFYYSLPSACSVNFALFLGFWSRSWNNSLRDFFLFQHKCLVLSVFLLALLELRYPNFNMPQFHSHALQCISFIFLEASSLTHGLFKSVLFSFQVLGYFPLHFLLISHFIAMYSEDTHCITSVL